MATSSLGHLLNATRKHSKLNDLSFLLVAAFLYSSGAMDSSQEAKVEKTRGKERGANLWFPLLLIVFCITFEYFSSMHLPQQGNLVNGGRAGNTETFSVTNARTNLKELTKFGPRVTGSKVTELSVTKYLKDKVKAVSKDLPSGVKIEIDQQNPASNFYLDFLGGMTNVSRLLLSHSF